MSLRVVAVDRPDVEPLVMPPRFRRDIAYFMTPAGQGTAPAQLPAGEYWIDADDARNWLDSGVLEIISPLDSARQAEVEISAEQEQWLDWLIKHGIRHVRLREG